MDLFKKNKKIVIGMAQPAALPGSYRHNGASIDEIEYKLMEEIALYQKYNYDSVILQNFHDLPARTEASVEAVAYMSRICTNVRREFPDMLLGVLMIWDGVASVAVAEAANADYVRVEHCYSGIEVTSTGFMQGQCVDVLALKKKLGSKIPVFADVFEPHTEPLLPQAVELACSTAVNECFADGLFLCGNNAEQSLEMAKRARTRLPNTPILLGGGATGDNVYDLLQYYDGVCVGTWIKDGSLSNPINPERVKIFMDQVERASK